MILAPADRPPAPPCPACEAPLTYVDTEASFEAFRPDAGAKPQTPVHHYDCENCRTCWTLDEELRPDPMRQIRKGEAWTKADRPPPPGIDPLASSRRLLPVGACSVPLFGISQIG